MIDQILRKTRQVFVFFTANAVVTQVNQQRAATTRANLHTAKKSLIIMLMISVSVSFIKKKIPNQSYNENYIFFSFPVSDQKPRNSNAVFCFSFESVDFCFTYVQTVQFLPLIRCKQTDL